VEGATQRAVNISIPPMSQSGASLAKVEMGFAQFKFSSTHLEKKVFFLKIITVGVYFTKLIRK
jgi:hypothetical protein